MNRLTRMPHAFNSPMTFRRRSDSFLRFHPWSEVSWFGRSGTKVHWLGRTRLTTARNSGELNVEGYPSPEFLAVVKRVRPSQCALVPDRPDQLTSDHGWNLRKESERLRKVIGEL